MRENVGNTDRTIRSIAGPALIGLGYTALGGSKGRIGGLATMILGTLIVESAITRVCPANALLGIDTRDAGRDYEDEDNDEDEDVPTLQD